MQRNGLTLFYSMPLDPQDWANLARSGVAQVMLPWRWGAGTDTRATLRELRRLGKRVILRLTETDMARPPAALAGELREYRALADLAGVILGVEPDSAYDLRWDSADWGTDAAWPHRAQVEAVRAALQAQGVPLVSPGHRQRGLTEGDPPDPGVVSWREICAPVYNQCDGNGVHSYGYNWASAVDEHRFRHQLRWWGALRHRTLWLDEVGIGNGSPLDRMRGCLGMARVLLGPAGGRVAMVAPFVSNGTGVAYDPGYVMRDPACYDAVAAFMRGA